MEKRKEKRLCRIFALKNMAAYPGNNFVDTVFYYPPATCKKRLWLKTTAKNPEIIIDEISFKPQNQVHRPWIDFGITDVNFDNTGFGQIKFIGVTPQEAADSYFLITTQINKIPEGEIENVEEMFWGIKRKNVGRTFINPSTIEVASPVNFELIFSASDKGLPKNSLIRLAIPLMMSEPQNDTPGKPGWITVTESTVPCNIAEIGMSGEAHEKYDVFFSLPNGLPPNNSIKFCYYTDITYLFPYTFETMERPYWYSKMPPLTLAVAVDERQIFVPPLEENGHITKFIAGPPERIHLFLPGRRHLPCNTKLVGIITDKYRNIVDDDIKDKIFLKLYGKNEQDLGSVKGHFTSKYRFEVSLPELETGIYRVKAFDEDSGELLAISNPMELLSPDSQEKDIYWGEIHGHCEMSDGLGGFTEMFTHARDVGTLDFAASADHACYFSDNQWEWMQDVCNNFNEDENFCTINGYEWAGKQGHRNIYTYKDRLELFRGMYGPTSNIEVPYKFFEDRKDVVAGPHTKHTGKFWDQHNPEVERFLEIYSMWGAFDELANDLLNNGAVIGFTGGGDCHEGHCSFSTDDQENQGKVSHGFSGVIFYKCGITGAIMERLDRKNLIKALQERKTYASTGPRILIDFSVNNILMGDVGKLQDRTQIKAKIHACAPIDKVEIIKNGKIVKTFDEQKLDLELNWEDPEKNDGKTWYYLRISQTDGEQAWTSPVWLEK